MPRLNHDVLDLITFMLREPMDTGRFSLFGSPHKPKERSCLLSFMDTCHALRELGVRHLLSSGVYISQYFNKESFHAFMFASPFTRFPYLRVLYVDPPHDCKITVEILQRSRMLEVLHIENCHPFIPEYAGLVSAINAMGKLRTLRMFGADQRIYDLLPDLGPQLEDICLSGDYLFRTAAAPIDSLLDASRLLSPVAAGLKTLDLSTSHLPGPPLHFPKVTNLSLSVCGAVDLLDFLSRLPVLEELHVNRVQQPGQNSDFETQMDNVRKVCEPWASKGPWPSIQTLFCGVNGLYGMVVSCKVGHLELSNICGPNVSIMVPVILNQTKPNRLQFEVIGSEIGGVGGNMLPKILKDAPPTLERLDVTIVIDICHTAHEMVTYSLDLLEGLDSLVYLNLGLYCVAGLDSDSSDGAGDTLPPLASIDPEAAGDYHFLVEMDPTAYVLEIASILPSIRHIDLMIFNKGSMGFSVDENRNVIPSRPLEPWLESTTEPKN